MRIYDRYVASFDTRSIPSISCDVAIFGSGVAGLSVACALPRSVNVLVLSKGPSGIGSTPFAQGGIAAAIGPDDSPQLHAEDTLRAGAGLANVDAVKTLTEDAPWAIDFLHDLGANFDQKDGEFALTLEGGHSRSRVLHAGGDASGAEVSRALFTRARELNVEIRNNSFLVDLLTEDGGGVLGALMVIDGSLRIVFAKAFVLASGGLGQLFRMTTSPSSCTGDGLAAAFRAGAQLVDLEFVQFHPTVLVSPLDPRPLISEALRGEGAIIRDANGNSVMDGIHPDRDLAPRDVVARQMAQLMDALHADHLFLDVRPLARDISERFPTISKFLADAHIDPAREMIPVSPAAHYTMGGVRTSIDGATTLRNLYAVGEAASTGIHGANRLASNSLMEGVVFGRRVANLIASNGFAEPSSKQVAVVNNSRRPATSSEMTRNEIRRSMERSAGVVRDGRALEVFSEQLSTQSLSTLSLDQGEIETKNMLLLADLVTLSALQRQESRGAHYRLDIPTTDDRWLIRQAQSRSFEGERTVDQLGLGE